MDRSVVIIGGGITGTLTAVRLARSGWRVTLLEAAHIGAGSSSRTAAGIRQQFSTRETVLGMRYAVDVYKRFPEEVGGLVSPIVQNGYLFLLEGEEARAAAAARVQTQQACGLHEVELLSAQETAFRFPIVDGDRISGATWCPTDGFLRPEVVYGEAAASARARGVRIVQGAPVVAGHHQGGRLVEVQAKGERFGADLFIDATNAWGPRTGRILGGTDLPVAPLKRYLWFLGRGGAMTGPELLRMPMVITPTGAYCHPENADSLMTGLAHDAPPEPDFDNEDQDRIDAEFDHRSGVDSRAYEVWAQVADALPAVGDFAGIHATTTGFYGATPDHNPFLAYDPAVPNLLRLVGFSGHGAMFGPFSALVADALAEEGGPLEAVEVLGQRVPLAAFAIGRDFAGHEAMVI